MPVPAQRSSSPSGHRAVLRSLRLPAGAALLGYGALVLGGVLPHDAPLAGAASALIGAVLLLPGLPEVAAGRKAVVAALGAAAAGGVVAWNLATGSDLSAPEALLLLYGLGLLAASWHLDRRLGGEERGVGVATLVGWSFPLLLAPLALFSLNAVASGSAGTTAAKPLIRVFLVEPTAWGLTALGTPNQILGNNLVMRTPHGSLAVAIGLVCAGLYPMVLFAGILGLHAWQRALPPRRLAAYLIGGLVGLWLFNLVRLIALAKVGVGQGAAALTFWHAHLGWLLFALFMVVFWAVVLRHEDRLPSPPVAG